MATYRYLYKWHGYGRKYTSFIILQISINISAGAILPICTHTYIYIYNICDNVDSNIIL